MASTGGAWNGAKVIARVRSAAAAGINETLAECVSEAKASHTGWNNQTGLAEGSMHVLTFATPSGNRIVGTWGSIGVIYMLYLEFLHGAALRTSADANYPTLPQRIRRSLS